ncbi:MAG: hypothetical protein KIS87_05760 [Phycisphaeraceae bacterium]|nr:hypothetical protein [Phycisphaeraceae bacterium]
MSLIELIVALAVVAALVGVAFPMFRGVRERAWDAKSLSNVRMHAANMLAYTGDWRGMFPYFVEPREGTTRLEGGGFAVDVQYFSLYPFWHLPMIDEYYGGRADTEIFTPPFYKEGSGGFSYYAYSMSFVADPAFWNPSKRTYTFDQLRATGVHDVVWTGEKGMIAELLSLLPKTFEHARAASHTPVGFVDGSTRHARIDSLTRPYPQGNGFWLGGTLFGIRVIHTIDGVRGRDFRD